MRSFKINEVYECIKDKTKLGSNNFIGESKEAKELVGGESKEAKELVGFCRNLLGDIWSDDILVKNLVANLDSVDPHEISLFEIVISSIFTEVYKCGNCGEQSALSVLEFLKSGINKSIDWVEISGLDINGNPANHSFALLDLDKKTDISDLKTWKGAIFFDTWGKTKPMSFHAETPKPESLSSGLIPVITGIKSRARFEKNLTPAQCDKLIIILKNLKKHYTKKKFIDGVKKTKRASVNIDKEFADIQEKIEEQIEIYKQLKLNPPKGPLLPPFMIHHYEKREEYTPALFNRRKKHLDNPPVPGKIKHYLLQVV
jgi:hypothetical protein